MLCLRTFVVISHALRGAVAAIVVGVVPAAHATDSLSIAAASDLVHCIPNLNKAFLESHSGAGLKTATGSSGNFFAQIRNGGPFDVFLSADRSYPEELVKAGLAEKDSLTVYAVGRIVLWTTRKDVDLSRGLEVIKSPAVSKFAIANPDHAPYGRAARAALEHAGLWQAAAAKLVLGENIAQTAQFIQTGNADCGIVSRSLASSSSLANVGKWVEIPANFHPVMEQAAVITQYGADNPLAKAYVDFLRSPEARAIFTHDGFELPK